MTLDDLLGEWLVTSMGPPNQPARLGVLVFLPAADPGLLRYEFRPANGAALSPLVPYVNRRCGFVTVGDGVVTFDAARSQVVEYVLRGDPALRLEPSFHAISGLNCYEIAKLSPSRRRSGSR